MPPAEIPATSPTQESMMPEEQTIEGNAVVRASKLNIRTGPGIGYSLAGDPLKVGTVVKPLSTQDGWTEVEYSIKGWVSRRYLASTS